MPDNADWRVGGQERYLTGVTLRWQEYRAPRPDWDHDHCAFCWAKFMEGAEPEIQHAGYATVDRTHWVCKQCFTDFQERFKWKVVE